MSTSATVSRGLHAARIPAIILAALILRLYEVNSPLWLDELYGVRLIKLGPLQAVLNSWTDPHPPLFYLIQWLVAGLPGGTTAFGLRWISVLCGAALVAILVNMSQDVAGRGARLVVCIVAATSPSLVFFSQEARPFALLILLASISMWLVMALLEDASDWKRWVGWIGVSVLGLYTGYAYVMVAAIQLAFLGPYNFRRAGWWVGALAVAASIASLVPFAVSSLSRVALQHAQVDGLRLPRAMMLLFAGEPDRYGLTFAHFAFPAAVLALALAAGLRAWRTRQAALGYFVIQAFAPLLAFFALSPLTSIRLPPAEAKQFMILVPAFLMLAAAGLSELARWSPRGFRLGRNLAFALSAAMLVMNLVGLAAYWRVTKSGEGVAMLHLRARRAPDESIVSLHYSLTYAIAYYIPEATLYLGPVTNGDTHGFIRTQADGFWALAADGEPAANVDAVRADGTFWIVARSVAFRDAEEALVLGCQLDGQTAFGAGERAIRLVRVRCPVENSTSASHAAP